MKKNWIIGIAIFLVLAIIGNIMKKNTKPKETVVKETLKPKIDEQCTMASVILKDYVKEMLDAPKTAEFPWSDYKCRYEGNGVYFVQSYVEFKNLYNVPLKRTYQITLQFDGVDKYSPRSWKMLKFGWLD